MPDPIALERLVSDVARQIRLRRAVFYGLRGLFFGAIAAVAPLLLREPLGSLGVLLAALLALAGFVAGACYGALLRVPPGEAARLADRGYGLQDRVATALEWASRPDRTPVVEALVSDATARAGQLRRRWVIPGRLPREARFIAVPVAAGL